MLEYAIGNVVDGSNKKFYDSYNLVCLKLIAGTIANAFSNWAGTTELLPLQQTVLALLR